ncbi:hypothetical protein QJQ45_026775, partial [Haematococcus lacustris]
QQQWQQQQRAAAFSGLACGWALAAADSADGYLSEMDRLTQLLDDLQQVDANFDPAAWPAPGTDYVFDMVMGLKQRRRVAIRGQGWPQAVLTKVNALLGTPSKTLAVAQQQTRHDQARAQAATAAASAAQESRKGSEALDTSREVIGCAVINLVGASALQPQRKKRKPENATDGGSTDSMDGLHLLKWLACLTFGNLKQQQWQQQQRAAAFSGLACGWALAAADSADGYLSEMNRLTQLLDHLQQVDANFDPAAWPAPGTDYVFDMVMGLKQRRRVAIRGQGWPQAVLTKVNALLGTPSKTLAVTQQQTRHDQARAQAATAAASAAQESRKGSEALDTSREVIGCAVINLVGASALQPQRKKRKPENATDGGSTDSMDGLHLLKWLACLTFGNLKQQQWQQQQRAAAFSGLACGWALAAADSADGYLSEMNRLTQLLDHLQQVDANFDPAAWPAPGTDYVFDMVMGLKQRRRVAIRGQGWPQAVLTKVNALLGTPSKTLAVTQQQTRHDQARAQAATAAASAAQESRKGSEALDTSREVIGCAVINLVGASALQPQRKKRKPENATDGGSTDSMDGLHLLKWLACLTFGNLKQQQWQQQQRAAAFSGLACGWALAAADSADGYLSEMNRLTQLLDHLQQVDANFDPAAWPAPGTDYVFDMVMGLKQRRRVAIRGQGWPQAVLTKVNALLGTPSKTLAVTQQQTRHDQARAQAATAAASAAQESRKGSEALDTSREVIGCAVINLVGASALQPQRKKRKPENATDGGSTDSMDGLHLLKWLACLTFGNLKQQQWQQQQRAAAFSGLACGWALAAADSADGYLSEMNRLTQLLDHLQQVDANFDPAAWPAPGTDYVFDMVMGLKQRRRVAITLLQFRVASGGVDQVNALLGTPSKTLAATQQQTRHGQMRAQTAASAAQESRKGSEALDASRD